MTNPFDDIPDNPRFSVGKDRAPSSARQPVFVGGHVSC